jgi:urea transport system permease protein
MLRHVDARARLLIALVLGFAMVVLALNLALPPSSPFRVPTYVVSLIGKYLCFALLALSVGLVWGYGGILSLGHGAFFALGGYAMGMYLMRQIGSRGVYGNATLPDLWCSSTGRSCPGTGTASTSSGSP